MVVQHRPRTLLSLCGTPPSSYITMVVHPSSHTCRCAPPSSNARRHAPSFTTVVAHHLLLKDTPRIVSSQTESAPRTTSTLTPGKQTPDTPQQSRTNVPALKKRGRRNGRSPLNPPHLALARVRGVLDSMMLTVTSLPELQLCRGAHSADPPPLTDRARTCS